MPGTPGPTSRSTALLAACLLALLAACGGTAAPGGPRYAEVAGQVPAVAPDRARLYFYRDYELYESQDRPYILLNGQVAGVSEPGVVSYRDVPPGQYLVSVDSRGLYPDQFKTVAVKGGETLYVKIESYRAYNEGRNGQGPATFVVAIIDPALGRREIDPMKYVAGP